MILLAQLKFRAGLSEAERSRLQYRMWLWPLSSYLALAFLILVVGLMAYFEETRIALYVGPAFLVLLTVLFYTFKLSPKQDSAALARSAS
ncbi:putative transport protein YifK [compost metagenome]